MAVFRIKSGYNIFHRVLSPHRLPGAPGRVFTWPWLSDQQHKHLYTPAALGLEQYLRLREVTSVRFENVAANFKSRMKEILATEGKTMIFTEDFKNTLHLVEDNEEDMCLVRDMARRFNKQHQGLRFGMYIFGPVVMRTYHALKQPQEALESLHHPELSGFFDQLVSYQLAMDLLYKTERYPQVLEVFDELQERRITGLRYPKNCLNLAIAACYKMNTQDSFEHLKGLLEKMEEYGIPLNRRLLVFSACLALAVGHPHSALDLVQRSTALTHITIRSIKVLSLCQLGRVEEAILALRSIIEIDLPSSAKSNRGMYILKEAVNVMEEAVKEGGKKEQQAELGRIVKCLEEANAILDKGLDEVVCQPIDKFEKRPGQDRAMLAASFSHTPSQGQGYRQRGHHNTRHSAASRPPRRPSLMDMEE